MSTLKNKKIKDTYEGLLKTSTNLALTGSLTEIQDGTGQDSGVKINNLGDVELNKLKFTKLEDSNAVEINDFLVSSEPFVAAANTKIPTVESVKNYVDSEVTSQDLDFTGNGGTGSVDLDSQIFDIRGSNGINTSADVDTLNIDGTELENGIATNVTNIATNATDIAANTTNITTNAGDINTNATNIATNVTNIGSNLSEISANTTNIGNLLTDVTEINTTAEFLVNKGQPSGYVPLDANSKILETYLPASIIGQLNYVGTWDATNDTPTLPDPTTVNGDYYIVSVAGTYLGVSYGIGDWIVSNGIAWEKIDNTESVSTVFGRLGNILANSTDYDAFYPTLTNLPNLVANNADVAANTLKVGITTAQANEIIANNDKISFDTVSSTRLADTSGLNTGDQGLAEVLDLDNSTNGNDIVISANDDITLSGTSKIVFNDLAEIKSSKTEIGSVNNSATGGNSLATGFTTTATGGAATAMGHSTIAAGNQSFAVGFTTNASGNTAVAMGNNTVASGISSTALGLYSVASGVASTATGYDNDASGANSTATGKETTASGANSTAMGLDTVADGFGTTAVGSFNTIDAAAVPLTFNAVNRAFVIGIGKEVAGVITREDAFTVKYDGTTYSTQEAKFNKNVIVDDKIGIRIANPQRELDVNGGVRIRGTLDLFQGNDNSFAGEDAGNLFNIVAGSNTGFGKNSQAVNVSGSSNTSMGLDSLGALITGNSNTAIGTNSMVLANGGSNNVALGSESLASATSGNGNTAIGHNALTNKTTTNFNTAVGIDSLANITTGFRNVAVGNGAGKYTSDGTTPNTTGTTSVFIGSDSKSAAIGQANQIVIGYDAKGKGANSAIIGNDSTEKLWVGGNNASVVLKSPNGTAYNIRVTDAGALVVSIG